MQTLVPYRRRGFLGRPFGQFGTFERSAFMPTDIEKTDEGLDFTVSLPGYDKDNVELELKDGYLTVTAETAKDSEKTEETEGGHYIRRERFVGSCRRAFYVGDEVDEDEVKAKFDGGVLKVTVPFVKAEEQPETKKLIEIEG